MPSRKRTVKYEENINPDEKDVQVTEEQSENNNDTTEQEDERYTPSAG